MSELIAQVVVELFSQIQQEHFGYPQQSGHQLVERRDLAVPCHM